MSCRNIKLLSTLMAIGVVLPCNANASEKKTNDLSVKDFSVTAFYGTSAKGFEISDLSYRNGDQKLMAAALDWTPMDVPLNFKLGLEAGLAFRDDGDTYGEGGTSQEIWFGPKIRHIGLKLGPILIKPAITLGFSYVTDSNGLELAREIRDNGDASFIYYGGPEVGLSLKSKRNLELVGRNHHRSGAGRVSYMPTIAKMGDVNNANLIGIRYRFK